MTDCTMNCAESSPVAAARFQKNGPADFENPAVAGAGFEGAPRDERTGEHVRI